jgi:predicted phosphodiesterase
VPHLILSDIHANLEALHAVLAHARGRYDRIICLGDLVGYGADPNAVVDWARQNLDVIVRGNHDKDGANNDSLDHYRAPAIASTLWTRANLTPQSLEYLRALPRGPLRYEDFDLVHGSPADEDEYLMTAGDAAPLRPYLGAQATFFGHTHIQGGFLLARGGARSIFPSGTLELEPDHFYLLNPGAVGQPRDGDPRAAYLLYWPKERLVEYCRVEYDVETAARKIRKAGLPESLAARLALGT